MGLIESNTTENEGLPLLSVIEVANYFIQRGIENRNPVTPLKLIKLCYIAKGTALAIYDHPLCVEMPEAWRYGPVFDAVYRHIKHYKVLPIDEMIKTSVFTNRIEKNKRAIDLLDAVYDHFGSWSDTQLSTFCHKDNSAWDITLNNAKKYGIKNPLLIGSYFIPDYLLKDEFEKIANRKPK